MPALHRSPTRIAALALLPVLASVLTGCGGSSGTSTLRRPPLVSIFEAPLELATAPGPTLDLLRRLGVDNVRVVMRWSSLAPSPTSRKAPAKFDASSPAAYPPAGWATYDAIVRAAQARHIGVLLDISGPAPRWATGPGAQPGGVPGVWKPSAANFGPFARAVGERYSGHYKPPGDSSALPRINFWSVWNEPNLGQANLAPQAIRNSTVETSPAMYRALLDAAWTSLEQTGHRSDTILFGELAPYGQSVGRDVPGTFGYMVPLRFLRALYCVDSSLHPLRGAAAAARACPPRGSSVAFGALHPALFEATAFAVHPYPQGAVAPNVVLPGEPDFANLAALPNLERVLDSVTATYGRPRKYPLYSTEYGYFTNPPFAAGAPLDVAARYLNWAEYISWRSPRIRSFNQYLLVDPPPDAPSKFVTGLKFFGGRPKPSYYAWRMPVFLPSTRQRGGHGLEVWGCVRPATHVAADTGQPQQAQIQLQPRARGSFTTVGSVQVTERSCYFDIVVKFPSSGNVRVRWSYPRGPTIFSRLSPVTVG